MTRLALLAARMLRYRVAAMIWLFMLLGAATRDGLAALGWRHALAALALGASYVAATTQNDVADREIDLVNHPRDRGRPLVSGEATVRDLWVLHAAASVTAVVAAAALGLTALALVALSLLVSWAYSLPPLRLAYRTYLAHPALGVAYVAIPYSLGVAAARGTPARSDLAFGAALFLLFLARIVLKDFRDREGDARYGKPTLLLRHGKRATCATSLAALLAGDALLLGWLAPPAAIAILLQLYVAAIAYMLLRLAREEAAHGEQVAIGIGAKMGNGFLIAVLATLVLEAHGAPAREATLFVILLAGLFGAAFVTLVAQPERAVVGYKG